MVVTTMDYEQIALAEPNRQWELHNGQLREKPPVSHGHNRLLNRLDHLLQRQLNLDEYELRVGGSRVRRSADRHYIPDLLVVPVWQTQALEGHPERLKVLVEPLPLVVEVWSPSTGVYDVDSKLPEYQARGDLEIWRLHPFDRTLTVWRRQEDGTYPQTVHREGVVEPVALPGVIVDLDRLFG